MVLPTIYFTSRYSALFTMAAYILFYITFRSGNSILPILGQKKSWDCIAIRSVALHAVHQISHKPHAMRDA
jgi:hypothetical protein